MADTAHFIAPQRDPSIIIERNRAFGIMRPSYVGTSWPDARDDSRDQGCGRELAVDPAIGHVGVVEGARELVLCGGGEYSAAIGRLDGHDSWRDTCCGHQ